MSPWWAHAAAIAFKGNYTDMDLLRFITNLECLEAQFEMYGVFGRNVSTNLTLSGPVPLGAKQANLTEAVRPYVQEIALSEQVNQSSYCYLPPVPSSVVMRSEMLPSRAKTGGHAVTRTPLKRRVGKQRKMT